MDQSLLWRTLVEVTIAQTTFPTLQQVLLLIDSLKNRVHADRFISIERRVEENRQKLAGLTDNLFEISKERSTGSFTRTQRSPDLLAKRQQDAIDANNGGRERTGDHEDSLGCTAVLHKYNAPAPDKSLVVTIMLPKIRRIPKYSTWLFLDRNELTTKDQSVEGRPQIYYDKDGGETLICSDSEEEMPVEEEEKRDFIQSEDFILCRTIKQLGLCDLVLESLSHLFSRDASEIKERYETLSNKENAASGSNTGDTEENFQSGNLHMEKDIGAAQASFDNLFCRRCLAFVCRLHGCSQDVVLPAEKQTTWIPPDVENAPCGPNCFLLVLKSENFAKVTSSSQADVEENCSGDVEVQMLSQMSSDISASKQINCSKTVSASSNAKNIYESSGSENAHVQDTVSPSKSVNNDGIIKTNSKRLAEHVLVFMQKRQKKAAISDSNDIGEGLGCSSNKMGTNSPIISSEDNMTKEEFVHEKNCQQEFTDNESWKPLEKGLLYQGMEMFGRNSCLIARNLLSGLKTCWEIYQYMNCNEGKMSGPIGDAPNSPLEDYSKGNNKVSRRPRSVRRRGKFGRLRFTWKSATYRSNRKRVTEGTGQFYKHYNPCDCQPACGKECPCCENGIYCEKYCGCPESCKNRFRGCRCAKNQCQTRQCPCFAANRECDPDICKNCWVSCGDGTLGFPVQRGNNYECRNMKFLLRQQRRILLGKSDVHGWGAFLKDTVEKNEYLGEYTGELISHREAEKRGKIYDRKNSSYLFNLDDQASSSLYFWFIDI
ncbi:putative histone-lysine N-methyltransferase chromatin remodeling SET family [Lupinus albus]|uniref:Putative histone-lysine N-methyltransferase chromatin remodeling SET family n=1 Tax=Lupinus albus TaxID=3870 RepID=A0A6A4Q2V9_LUPAL|nr:putative histone-lysine N-methyltransferase chromatin remodeling SET family [Lupinus albus]